MPDTRSKLQKQAKKIQNRILSKIKNISFSVDTTTTFSIS